jgi:hypothetical protein
MGEKLNFFDNIIDLTKVSFAFFARMASVRLAQEKSQVATPPWYMYGAVQ